MKLSQAYRRKIFVFVPLLAVLFAALGVWGAGAILSLPAARKIENLPGGFAVEPVAFASQSGATLRGWFIPGQPGAGIVILMHGYRGDRSQMAGRVPFLVQAEYGVLLFDFQAHGESVGKQITLGYLESLDAQAAVAFIKERYPAEKVGVVGLSLGGAAAVLATPPLPIDALILEMVYPDIHRATANRLARYMGNWARPFTPLLTWQLKPRLGIDENALRPIARVSVLPVPKLFIAGEKDRHTPLSESAELFAAAQAPKEFWVVPGAPHGDAHQMMASEYEQRVLAFLAKHLRRLRR